MKLELISFKLCPFAQRAIISLNAQNVDYKMTYINPMDPPDWFKEISPTGQVPLLKADDTPIFESLVITEFINEISEKSLHPTNIIKAANNRSWIIYSSDMLGDMFNIITGNEEKFNAAKTELMQKFAKVSMAKTQGKFFNGNEFNMIDAAFAPIFMRLAWINEFTDNAVSLLELPEIKAWSDEILALDVVKNSVDEGLDDVYLSNIENREGYLSTLLID
ncbi:glutathione S-transferase family protein [Bathymodiolus septemdierum thioautotrophic gill symbiont]|uniref:Glutathione S-transferase n=1 Tax=endosymbiont of Bathymodiolus septemdierum str. Myojin knoll TaxID=1303921 RepID=A0A0N7KBC1_9GAMM|nr:glutathione S-transferase family protein [Bathymodiolus septemdierum thioautotrophic gill symbiont]BAS67599.1 glutathione S-transferase [endosymbiont of Bathymodiolus septemdierum str. Myojin knoll]